MSLTKNRIIKDVHRSADLTKSQSVKTVESAIEIIKKTLESDEDVLISGFGKFFIKENSKRGCGKHKGNGYIPGAKKVVAFKCSPVLIKKINKNG